MRRVWPLPALETGLCLESALRAGRKVVEAGARAPSIAGMHFERWSLQHLGILIGTGALAWWAVQAGRRADRTKAHRIGAILAGVQIANTLLYMIYRIASGAWDVRYDLPMEFCNWSLVFSMLALYTHGTAPWQRSRISGS